MRFASKRVFHMQQSWFTVICYFLSACIVNPCVTNAELGTYTLSTSPLSVVHSHCTNTSPTALTVNIFWFANPMLICFRGVNAVQNASIKHPHTEASQSRMDHESPRLNTVVISSMLPVSMPTCLIYNRHNTEDCHWTLTSSRTLKLTKIKMVALNVHVSTLACSNWLW